jgi:uncharacterized RDD family membrane protein YckC
MKTQSISDFSNAPTAGLFRRLGAIFYDLLLLVALMFMATAIITLPLSYPEGFWLLIFQLFIFEIIPLIFFTSFWVLGGQTLGMRAWRLKLVRTDNTKVGWNDAIKRHFASLLSLCACGLGFAWILIDPHKMAWHDKLSKTRLIVINQ